MNKKLACLFAVLVLGLFVISACEQTVGIKPAKNLRDLEINPKDNNARNYGNSTNITQPNMNYSNITQPNMNYSNYTYN